MTKGKHMVGGGSTMKQFIEAGFKPIPGFQLRYIYFLNHEARQRLTVPILPFSKIDELGAGMYKGERVARSSRRPKRAEAGDQPEQRRFNSDPDAPSTPVATE